jgi:hypothetical protein
VQVHVGAPIDAAQYGVEERDRLMADVRAAIVELSGEQELAPAGKAASAVDCRARS